MSEDKYVRKMSVYMPDKVSERMSEDMPEIIAKYCFNTCQKNFQVEM